MTHSTISPAILYWGTPVVIVSSENEDGSNNLAPISAVFWLGHRCVLGFAAMSKTPQNIIRTGQCVVNMPDDTMANYINKLALTTGSDPIPPMKIDLGYRAVKDKWALSGLTPQSSELVRPARVLQCPVQMECELSTPHEMLQDIDGIPPTLVALELRVVRCHVTDNIRMEGHKNRIDPDKWHPTIMSFQRLYGLSGTRYRSDLNEVEEEKYRGLADLEDECAVPNRN